MSEESKSSKIVKLHLQGLSNASISGKLNTSLSYVRQVLYRKNLSKPNVTKHEDMIIADLAILGKTSSEIAMLVNKSQSTVTLRIRRMGLSKGRGRPIGRKRKPYKWLVRTHKIIK